MIHSIDIRKNTHWPFYRFMIVVNKHKLWVITGPGKNNNCYFDDSPLVIYREQMIQKYILIYHVLTDIFYEDICMCILKMNYELRGIITIEK